MISDHGEDEFMLAQFPDGYQGFAAEVGAANGLRSSNTLLLEQRDWRVLCVEPNPVYQESLSLHRREYVLAACASADAEDQAFHAFYRPDSDWLSVSSLKPVKEIYMGWGQGTTHEIHFVPVRRLSRLLDEAQFPKLDALSVDTEGNELEVLVGANLEHWCPKVIVVELWPSTRQAIGDYLGLYGYKLAEERGVNGLFLKEAKDGYYSGTTG